MNPYLQFAWAWTARILVALGGLAGITKIFEWLLSGPKIVGEIQQTIVGSLVRTSDNTELGTHFLALVYLVNKRINPVSIKNYELLARVEGKWVKGQLVAIPAGFKLQDAPQIDFNNANLYERASLNLLEYGKGVNGWVRAEFMGIPASKIRAADYRVKVVDAFGGTHKVFYKHGTTLRPTAGHTIYIPGSGIPGR